MVSISLEAIHRQGESLIEEIEMDRCIDRYIDRSIEMHNYR